MGLSNHERVGSALEVWRAGLPAFVERELKSAYGTRWWATARQVLGRGMQVGGADAAAARGDLSV